MADEKPRGRVQQNSDPSLARDRIGDLLPGPLTRQPGLDAGARAVPASELWNTIQTTGPKGDRLEVHEELAHGGMGAILRAYDGELRRWLAMKVIRDRAPSADLRLVASGQEHARFLEEAQVTSQLDHPGIVPVHEIGMHSEFGAYYTMRLVAGEPLSTVFDWVAERRDGWSQTRCLEVMLKVCDTVSYAHERGVVHRDLKPNNVMVGRFGEVYVMDWGLARIVAAHSDGVGQGFAAPVDGGVTSVREDLRNETPDCPFATIQGDAIGTPCYMAPEQACGRNEEIGPHTDVYAVGAMLYQLIARRQPFTVPGTTSRPAEILERLRAGPPEALEKLAGNCAPELIAICAKAMRRDIPDRYATMAALGADLRAYLEGRVVGAYETGRFAEIRKWVGRNLTLAIAMVVAGVALVAGGTAGVFYFEKTLEESKRSTVGDVLDTIRAFARSTPNAATVPPGVGRWLEEAEGLIAGGKDGNLGLHAYESQLADLQAGIRHPESRSEDDQLIREMEFSLEKKREEHLWRARMLAREPWPDPESVRRDLESWELPTSALGLNKAAFALINPDRARSYGEEQHAVRIAERALEETGGDPPRCGDPDRCLTRARCLDTLAWTLCRIGKFELARHAQLRSVHHAREHDRMRRTAEEPVRKQAYTWLQSIEGNQRVLQREVHCWTTDEAQRRQDLLETEIQGLAEALKTAGLHSPDTITEWWHQQLRRVVHELRSLARQVEFAKDAASRGDAPERWRVAIEAIAADPGYDRIEITPQLFLYPLGPDPESGLQEFAYLPSGLAPTRGKNQKFRITRNSAIVLVLLPGNAQVAPMFFGKHEVTNAQWARLQGRLPVGERDRYAFCPRTRISWDETRAAILGSWLRLPTVDEWRYACRAGRDAGWHEALALTDLRRTDNVGPFPPDLRSLEPVDRYAANPFGLHEMIGNVSEWCDDRAAGTGHDPRNALELQHRDWRVYLGGHLRLERRKDVAKWIGTGQSSLPTSKHETVGVRLARSIAH